MNGREGFLFGSRAWSAPYGLLVVALLAIVGCTHPALLPPKAIDLNREGARALAVGNLELAEARVALALEYNPRFTEAWVNLGLVELRRDNIERARRDFSRLASSIPICLPRITRSACFPSARGTPTKPRDATEPR